MTLVLASIVGTFVWDRICTAIFSPRVFRAMLDAALETTPKDLLPLLTTIVKVRVWHLPAATNMTLLVCVLHSRPHTHFHTRW